MAMMSSTTTGSNAFSAAMTSSMSTKKKKNAFLGRDVMAFQKNISTKSAASSKPKKSERCPISKVIRMTDKQTDALRNCLEVRNVDIIHAGETTTDIIHPNIKYMASSSTEASHASDSSAGRSIYGKTSYDTSGSNIETTPLIVEDSDDDHTYHGECGHGGVHSHADHHSHDHEEKHLHSAIAAGAINVFIMFGFCIAYGLIIFTDDAHQQHRVLGIKMNLATAALFGLLLALFSKVPVAIGGPDMNPVLFVAVFVDKISLFLREDLKSKHSHNMVLNTTSTSRLLSAAMNEEVWCTGEHLLQYGSECEDYHERLRATTIFTVTIASLAVSVVFFSMGQLKLTRYFQYIPTSIVDAFLSCMGYKVFKYSLKLCKYDPKIFVPAAAVGVPLYFLKAYHIGNPIIVMPSFVIGPIVIFYGLLYASGGDVESARKDSLLFAEVHDEPFWSVWTDGLYNYQAIEFDTLFETWHHILIMLGVCILDCLVTALRTTEAKLPIKVNKHYEVSLYGLGNLASAIVGSPAGYMQLKFNVISYGIMHNVKDRRAGIIYALACFALFFAPLQMVNYMPRIFIGLLMFFGGSSFVAEHLWGSREYLSFLEWIQVFLILAIFIFFDILWAVLLGSILCGLTFIVKYAKMPCIVGRPQRGAAVKSREHHPALLEMAVRHLLNNWMLIVRLKGFIFFASVQTIMMHIRKIIEEENEMGTAAYRRLQYVLFDCELLDGMDSSAEKDIQQLAKDLAPKHVRILWTALPENEVDEMVNRQTIRQQIDAFPDIDSAIIYVEGQALAYRRKQQRCWAELHPAFELHQQLKQLRECYEPFSDILRMDVERFGCPWEFITIAVIQKYKSLLWVPKEHNRELFLVHTGAVGLFKSIPGRDGSHNMGSPIGVYRHGWFLNREATMRAPTRHYALALEDGELLYWNQHDWCRMTREQPLMASALIEEAMRQSNADMEKMSQILRSMKNAALDEELHQKAQTANKYRNSKLVRSTTVKREAEEEAFAPPEDLHNCLEGISAAMSLEAFGLYKKLPAKECGALPDLPRRLSMDLQGAFFTYCTPNVRDGQRGIQWELVPQALMYAGLFGALLVQEQKIEYLTEDEFVQIGHEAFMTRLSNKMVVKLYNHLGRKVTDGGGMLARDVLVDVLQEELLPGVSDQEVNGIAYTWEDDGSGMISVSEFMGIVSRFVRRHEQDWNVLRGIRDCLGAHGVNSQNKKWLTPEKLRYWSDLRHVDNPEQAVDLHQAEEMLWAAACHTDLQPEQHGEVLDWAGIAAAVLVNVDRAQGKLPPQPKTLQDIEDDEGLAHGDAGLEWHAHCHRNLRQSINEHHFDDVARLEQMSQAELDHLGAEHKRWLHHREQDENWMFAGLDDVTDALISGAGVSVEEDNLEIAVTHVLTQEEHIAVAAQETKTAFRRAAILKSAKRKLKRCVPKLLAAAQREASLKLGLPIRSSPMQGKVMDLRDTPACYVTSCLFQKGRVSAVDFNTQRTLDSIREPCDFHTTHLRHLPDTPEAKLYLLLEEPGSSLGAFMVSIFMGFCILGSVAALFVQSLVVEDESKLGPVEKQVFKALECLFTIIFCCEFILRLSVCDVLGECTQKEFLTKPINICDMFAIFPFFLELAFAQTGTDSNLEVASLLKMTRLMRLARVARIARLSRSKKTAIFGPVAAVFTVIWGIYLK